MCKYCIINTFFFLYYYYYKLLNSKDYEWLDHTHTFMFLYNGPLVLVCMCLICSCVCVFETRINKSNLQSCFSFLSPRKYNSKIYAFFYRVMHSIRDATYTGNLAF